MADPTDPSRYVFALLDAGLTLPEAKMYTDDSPDMTRILSSYSKVVEDVLRLTGEACVCLSVCLSVSLCGGKKEGGRERERERGRTRTLSSCSQGRRGRRFIGQREGEGGEGEGEGEGEGGRKEGDKRGARGRHRAD
eukprot:2709967-Rhodomonas_salina.1